jgi:hypothetical protein
VVSGLPGLSRVGLLALGLVGGVAAPGGALGPRPAMRVRGGRRAPHDRSHATCADQAAAPEHVATLGTGKAPRDGTRGCPVHHVAALGAGTAATAAAQACAVQECSGVRPAGLAQRQTVRPPGTTV